MRSVLNGHSVVGQMFVLHVAVVLLLATAAVATLVLTTDRETTSDASDRSFALAQGFASAPRLAEALTSSNATAALQPKVEEAAKGTGVDFLGVLDRDGIIRANSDPKRIGTHTHMDMASLLAGRSVKDEGEGKLGPQVRGYVPVRDDSGSVVGAVGAGVTLEHVSDSVVAQLLVVLTAAIGAVAITLGGTALISRRLLRQTYGLGPSEITRMYEHHDAVLHSVKEGVLIVDEDSRLLLANDEARRLLNLSPEAESRNVGELHLPPSTASLMAASNEATDEVHLVEGRVLVVNRRCTDRYGGPSGSVTTLRDSTELQALSGTVQAARQRLKVLYDASVNIGTTLDVTQTAEELTETAVPLLADFATVDLAGLVLNGEEPADPQQTLSRIATTRTREDHPLYLAGGLISFVSSTPQSQALTTGRAVLEADLHTSTAWRTQDHSSAQRIIDAGFHSLITVPLSARGTVLGVASFWRSQTPEPFEEDDLSLAEELAARAAVCIDNARRYTREHTMAVTLQRSLLPRDLQTQSALDVAHRYLPADAGVGGDWFDIIPLPGARVALVVGDVVGHGVHAAATMGRLRTAVHNFSALDLSPDELLGHLDELVNQIDQEDTASEDNHDVTGATCLYAIYDPVSGQCTMARAGHPPPAVVRPDGTVEFPDLPANPPLGVDSGLPFESTELSLPEGSRIILYTDGLVEDRHRDLDTGLGLLRAAVIGRPSLTPEDTCRDILGALLPERPSDDIALMVARTRRLDPERVARWEVPPHPSAVGSIRNQCANQLKAWGLEGIAFNTELILSELITNAIRYGTQPIRVRMLYDLNLICEVSDGSSTSPHLRRAATTDEGGRGLFLIAQYAERWGTRYPAHGKIIWTEQALHDEAKEPDTDPDTLLDLWAE
ncbi:SpoIIE family protein phosphatase [Streptomyces sp. MS2.AVA.5]|uniref:SpoIIE family protein phosphatase n=1 Tax=Streptomyces achmelvichensis TaxID=3134111 RepID=A0ACC6Q8S4_9ACTN